MIRLFHHERDSVDLRNAYKIVRSPRGDTKAEWAAQEWDYRTEDGWSDTGVLWRIGRANINSEAVPITQAEAERLMADVLEKRRATGN